MKGNFFLSIDPHPRKQDGFSLTELAVVLVIVTLLIGGMLIPLAAQDDLRRTQETQKILGDVRDALLGFASATGRLPCPASAASNGLEEFCSTAPNANPSTVACGASTQVIQNHGRCSHPYDGFFPAATLGIQPTNNQGLLIDGWNQPIRYGVTQDQLTVSPYDYAFTGTNGMKNKGLSALAPDLVICTNGADATLAATAGMDTADCTAANRLTNAGVAVAYSLGRNGPSGGTSVDERQNPNVTAATSPTYITPDRLFIFHEPAPPSSPNGEFDDLVVWLSPSILFNRMIAAGRLP